MMRAALLNLLVFWGLAPVHRAAAEVEARSSYIFRPAQNGVVSDEGSARQDAKVHISGSEAWVDTEQGPAVELKNAEDRIDLPAAAFPGSRGALRITFRPDSVTDSSQYLFRVYQATGDGLMLYLREGTLNFRYYNRATNTNVVATLPADIVRPGEWTTATASWDLEKDRKILVQVDARRKVGKVVSPDIAVHFDDQSQIVVGNDHAGALPFLGAIQTVQLFDKPLWDDPNISSKPSAAALPKVARERVLPRTLFFSRTQPKYNLFSNTLLRRWIDRPLFFDRRTEESTKPFSIVSSASFLKLQESARAYGLDGLGSLLSVPTQGTAFLEMLDAADSHPGRSLPLVLEVAGAMNEHSATQRLEIFERIAEPALRSPNVMRVNGRILVLTYAIDSEPMESWHAFRTAVRERFGDQFLFITDVTTRRPALLREFQEMNGVSERTLEGFRQHLRQWLDVSDGIMWAGGSHTNLPDGTLDRAFYRDFLVPVFNGVLNEQPYRGKLLGLDAEVGYVNVMTSRRTNPEEGTRRLRDNFEIALEANPDFITMPEWDELNENTSIAPTLTNSLSTQRIIRSYISKFSGDPSRPLPGDDTSVPNLVLSFTPYVKLGDRQDFEILSIPDGSVKGDIRVELSLKNLQGEVVHSFPPVALASDRMADHTFSLPSELLASDPAVTPSLKVTTADGRVSQWENGLETIRLLPTWNLNYKVTKIPLRDLLQPKEASFRLSSDQPGSGVKVEGSISCDEPIMSVEVVQDSRELYAMNSELNPASGEALIMLYWQSMRNPIPFEGRIEVRDGSLRKFADWTRPEYKRSSYHLAAKADSDGRQIVPFSTDSGVNSTNARGGFFLIENPESAILSMKTNLFTADFPVKDIMANGQIAKVFPNGLTVQAKRLDTLAEVPYPLLKNDASFVATVHPWRKDTPLQMRVITESGKIYRSAPVMPYTLSDRQIRIPVWSESTGTPVEVSLSSSRVPDIAIEMDPRGEAVLPTSGGSYFYGLVGGVPFDMGAFAKRALRNAYPSFSRDTSPEWTTEDGKTCLRFDGKGNFLYFPEETLPRGSFTLEFEIKPDSDSLQVLCTSRGYRRGALTLMLDKGKLIGQWLDRDDKITPLDTGLSLPLEQWSRVRVSYDLTSLQFSVNGQNITLPAPKPASSAIAPFIFGGYGNGRDPGYFSGLLRNLRIYHGSEFSPGNAQVTKSIQLSLAKFWAYK